VQEAIDRLMVGRTVLVVAHRLRYARCVPLLLMSLSLRCPIHSYRRPL